MCRRNTANSREQFDVARRAYKQIVRKTRVQNSVRRDAQVDQIISTYTKKVYSLLKRIKGGKK